MPRLPAAVLLLAGFSLQTVGPVRELVFEPAADGNGMLVHWLAPAGLDREPGDSLEYELQDRGSGTWRPVHRGPESRLRILQLRVGACRLRVRALAADAAGPWNEIDCTVDIEPPTLRSVPPACDETTGTACLLDERFLVRVYRTVAGEQIPAVVVSPGDDSASRRFRFDEPESTIVDLTVLDLCATNGHFGLEYRVQGDLAFEIRITDRRGGRQLGFAAPAGRDRPLHVAYREVFATCG